MTATRSRILIVDDNPDIHADFRKVLTTNKSAPEIDSLEASLFGDTPKPNFSYTLDFASQGADAVEMVRKSVADADRYCLAFVDVRMPPGMDGVSTIQAIRNVDPTLTCIICTAYSDYTPESARQKIGIAEGLMFISKPFDPAIIRQLAKKMLDQVTETSAPR
jgi:CheY-like chemotaxis protein